MNLRPFQIVLIAVFALGALLGIYVFSTGGGFGPQKEQVGTVIIWGTLPQETLDAAVQEVVTGNDAYSDVAYIEKSAASFSSDLANAIASGSGPDLVLISQEELVSERSKLQEIPFASLPQRTFLDSFVPIAELFLTSTGTYGIPFLVDPLVLYYNRTTLSSAGIASAPNTWEAVAGLASTLSIRDARGFVSKSLIALGGYDNVRNARAILSLLFMQAGSPVSENTQQGIRASLNPPADAALNFYVQFADPAKTVYSWNRSLPESRKAFTTGDTALYLGYASEQAFIAAANPNLDFDIAAVPQPGVTQTRMTYGKIYAFAIPKASSNTTGAYLVASALSESNPSKVAADLSGAAPARRSLLGASAGDKYAAVTYPAALIARGWLSPAPGTTDSVFSAMIENVITGRMDADAAIGDASKILDAALR